MLPPDRRVVMVVWQAFTNLCSNKTAIYEKVKLITILRTMEEANVVCKYCFVQLSNHTLELLRTSCNFPEQKATFSASWFYGQEIITFLSNSRLGPIINLHHSVLVTWTIRALHTVYLGETVLTPVNHRGKEKVPIWNNPSPIFTGQNFNYSTICHSRGGCNFPSFSIGNILLYLETFCRLSCLKIKACKYGVERIKKAFLQDVNSSFPLCFWG